MYICPTCQKEFAEESKIVKHYLNCWKERNPNHKSVSAPRGEDIITRNADNNVLSFFDTFGGKND